MDGSANIAETRIQSIRDLYGRGLSDSDCREIEHALTEYARVLLEIDREINKNDQAQDNNPTA